MPLVNVWQDEDVFYRFLTGSGINDHANIPVELDTATLSRWTRIQQEYDQMQDEMYEVRQKSIALKKSG